MADPATAVNLPVDGFHFFYIFCTQKTNKNTLTKNVMNMAEFIPQMADCIVPDSILFLPTDT